jgi:peptide/nickel transport system permease protein
MQAIPTFFGITILSYMLMSASGNPVQVLTFKPNIKPEEIQRVARMLGVTDPWPVQYLRWLLGDDWMRWDADGDGNADGSFLLALTEADGSPLPPGTRRGVLRGDFGNSFLFKRPVIDMLTERLPATLELSVTQLVIGGSIGVLLGILSAVRRGSIIDNVTRVLSVMFNAVPTVWLGLILLLVFGSYLKLLPLGDRCGMTLEPSCPPIWQRVQYMVLPVLVLASGFVAGYSRIMRASMLDIIGQDYVRTARAKGLRANSIWLLHAAKNALIPIATTLGPAITGLLTGAVLTETIFNYPGVGKLLTDAAIGRDYPMVMASVIYGAFATILGYLLSDILYSMIDPRIRFK